MDFLGVGPGELLLIMVVVLVVFGPGKIPEIARGLGKTVQEFRKATAQLSTTVKNEINKVNEPEHPMMPPKAEPRLPVAPSDPDDTLGPGAGI